MLVLGMGAGLLMLATPSQVFAQGSGKKKVIVFGMDGLDPKVAQELMAQKQLPNFQALADKGGFSALRTTFPPQSPVSWSSISTGVNPGSTGVYDFLVRNPKTYLPDLGLFQIKSGLMGTKYKRVMQGATFGEVLAAKGVPATLLKWPMTFPVQGEGPYKLLAGLGVPDVKGTLGNHTLYSTQPKSAFKDGREKVVQVRFEGDTCATAVFGPLVASLLGNKKPAEVPLVLRRLPGGAGIVLRVGEGDAAQEHTLRPGQWTPWVQVRFGIDPIRSVSGICRFHLGAAEPELSLYCTPVNIAPADPMEPVSYPEAYAKELQDAVGPYSTLGIPEDTKALLDGHIDHETFIELCDAVVDEQEKIFWHEFNRFNEGVLGNVFFSTDRIQHIFWAARDPGHPAYSEAYAKKYQDVIPSYYRRMDAVLGEVLKNIDDQTMLIACSDHGFTTYRRNVNLNTWLAEQGFMTLKTPKAQRDDNGAPLFADVDWGATSAYSLGLGSIYVNLKGREGKGVVKPEEYDKVVAEINKRLLAFKDPQGGANVVTAVHNHKDFSGPMVQKAPDVIVGFNTGYRASWQSAVGAAPPDVVVDNTAQWTGDHCIDPAHVPGLLITNFPHKAAPGCLDIAPTVLGNFGIQAPTDGSSLAG